MIRRNQTKHEGDNYEADADTTLQRNQRKKKITGSLDNMSFLSWCYSGVRNLSISTLSKKLM